MNRRRRRGATLGLVAVCVLVIIVVGIGCFFLAKIFGGGREVANATDAGVLNVAKNAMRNGNPLPGMAAVGIVPAANSNFLLCAQPPAGGGTATIDLLTYNRCVAQALLVAVNAKNEGTGLATTNAQAVISELNSIGSQLTNLVSSPNMESYFNAVRNDTKMWGNNALNPSGYTTAWMKTNGPTNVWFTTNEITALGLPSAADPTTTGTNLFPPTGPNGTGAATGNYMQGYTALTVAGITDAGHQIFGVPVFPQQNPHLVSGSDFNKAAAQPGPSVPPNAFQISTSTTEAKSGALGGAVAAAIVGAVKTAAAGGGAAAQQFQFPAAIPGGYIELTNLPGNTLPAGYKGYDNSDNIFNNELYMGPGIDVASVAGGGGGGGGPIVFSNTDMSGISAWAAFNNSGPGSPGYVADTTYGPNPLNGNKIRNANLDPMSAHPPSNFYVASSPGGAGVPAQTSDMLKVMSSDVNCLNDLNANGQLTDPRCANWLATFEQTYHPGPSGSSPADRSKVYSDLDIVKGEVIANFQAGAQSINVNAALPAHGLGVLVNGFGRTPTPQYGCPIMVGTGSTCTINNLLGQVDQQSQVSATCATQGIVNQISQRCYEIKPDASPTDVANLFNQPLPMNTTLYIYLPNGDSTQQLTISATAPTTQLPAEANAVLAQTTTADGNGSTQAKNCYNQYDLVTTLVDTEAAVQNGPYMERGDDALHDMPYRTMSGSMYAQDKANWIPSSGSGNLLGALQFSNQTFGDESFSRPN